MSELIGINTKEYSSELNEISEIYLKVELVTRKTYGEYEHEPKNGFTVDYGYRLENLNLDKCEVYELKQPTLNEQQQIVLDWSKPSPTLPDLIIAIADVLENNACLPESDEKMEMAFKSLTDNQILQVLSQWVIGQERMMDELSTDC